MTEHDLKNQSRRMGSLSIAALTVAGLAAPLALAQLVSTSPQGRRAFVRPRPPMTRPQPPVRVRPRPMPPVVVRPRPPFYNQGRQRLVQQVNQQFRGRNTLGLGRMFRLRQYRGMQIARVIVHGQLANGRRRVANMQLYTNNQMLGQGTLDGYNNRVVFRLGRGMQIGRQVRGLQLETQGPVYISQIVIVLRSNQGGGRGGQYQQVNQQFRGSQSLYLSDYFRGLNRGGQINQVIVYASSRAGRGQISLCGARACSYSSTATQMVQPIMLSTQGVGAFNPAAMRLQLQGNIYIEAIEIR